MPTLFRLLLVIALIAGLVYGAMIALVTYVHVQPREIIQTVPPAKLEKER
ncbi:MAG TPA: histidine kinase [Roseiarcus sp.]|nr:histidine kinase [Roseiarcus sp.]